MKKAIVSILFLMVLCTTISISTAEVLPPINELFETNMPNMENALQRDADRTEELDNGSIQMTFFDVGAQEFDVCNTYLGNSDCEVSSISMEDGVMTAQLTREGRLFSFNYDQAAQALVLTYPVGTYPEVYYKPGIFINFGHYEQDNNTENGAEPIEWLVLEVENERALIISRYALDSQPYNTTFGKVTWETCSLRTWLNGTFLNTAFSPTEQLNIITTRVFTLDYNIEHSYSTTQDMVFLLDTSEAMDYFSGDAARKCQPTKYATARGVRGKDNCTWALRSLAMYDYCVAVVYEGRPYIGGSTIYTDHYAIRPVLWISLDSGID